MRRTLMLAVLFSLLFSTFTRAQEKPAAAPTSDAVVDCVGGRLAKVFARFGTPVDVRIRKATDRENDAVVVDYETFSFRVRDKLITTCLFLKGWKEPVRGVNLGDTRDAVIKALGEPAVTEQNDDGTEDLAWELKSNDARMWVLLGKDKTVHYVQIDLK